MFYLEKILSYNLDQTRLQKRGEWHLPSWYTDSLFFSVGIVEHEEKLTIKPKGLQEVLAVGTYHQVNGYYRSVTTLC